MKIGLDDMRKLAIWLLAILAASSCSREVLQDHGVEGEVISVYAEWSGADDTKTAVQPDGITVKWTAKEQINLFYGNKAGKLISANTEPTDAAEFSGVLSVSPDATDGSDSPRYWAVYPFSEVNSCDGESVTLTVPKEQEAAEGTFADKFFPAVAVSETPNMVFRSVCGGSRFSVSQEGITSVVITSLDGVDLAGKVKVGVDAGNEPYVLSVEAGETSVTINAPEGGFVPGHYYFAALLPGAHSKGLQVRYYRQDGSKASYVVDKCITVHRGLFGKLDNLDSGLTFTSGIDVFFTDDSSELEGWSELMVISDGTYIAGKPDDAADGYVIQAGNVVDNQTYLAYFDNEGALREIYFDGTIVAFKKESGVYTEILYSSDESGFESIAAASSAQLPSYKSEKYSVHPRSSKPKALSLYNFGAHLREIHDAVDCFKEATTKAGKVRATLSCALHSAESLDSWIESVTGVSLFERWNLDGAISALESFVDFPKAVVDFVDLLMMTSVPMLAWNVANIYTDLVADTMESYYEHIDTYYGNCTAEVSAVYENETSAYIHVNVQGHESWQNSFEVGVAVGDLWHPGFKESNPKTTVTGNDEYEFYKAGLKSGVTYHCRPYIVDKSRDSFWVGFLGKMAGPLVRYGSDVSFTTLPESDEVSIFGHWTCVWNTTPPNAKLLRMTLGSNYTMAQTYYYANKGKNISYHHRFSYSGSELVFYKSNGDVQTWYVNTLTRNSLVITAANDGFTYTFSR